MPCDSDDPIEQLICELVEQAGTGEDAEERRKKEAEEFGYNPATYGKNPSQPLPPGWSVNQGTGALIPPGGGEIQGIDDSVMPGELFEMNGALYQWNGTSIVQATDSELKRFQPTAMLRSGVVGRAGGFEGSSFGDPFAAEANARDAARLAEQIRAQRIREAQDAADAIQARLQAAQQARLEGAKFSVTPSMAASGGYFPGLQPDSPIVRQGLAQPFQYNPVGFNPERGVNMNEGQIAADLAMIRRIAGTG